MLKNITKTIKLSLSKIRIFSLVLIFQLMYCKFLLSHHKIYSPIVEEGRQSFLPKVTALPPNNSVVGKQGRAF